MKKISMTVEFVIEVAEQYFHKVPDDFFIELNMSEVIVGRMDGETPTTIHGNVLTYETIDAEWCE